MKKILCFISVCVMLMLSTVTSSAAAESKFKLRLVSENDSQAVISLDFEGGTSFSAIDFNVEVNTKKVKVTDIVDGKGMMNFKMQAQAAVSQPNIKGDIAMVTAAMIPGYRNVDGEDLFVITLKKLTKEKITADDIKIVFTNCQDAAFSHIKPVVTYEFSSGTSGETVSDPSTTTIAVNPTDAEQTTDNKAEQSAEVSTSIATAANADEQEKEETAENEKGGNKTVIIVICVLSAVAVGGGAGVAYIFMKKKKNGNEAKKESKEG